MGWSLIEKHPKNLPSSNVLEASDDSFEVAQFNKM